MSGATAIQARPAKDVSKVGDPAPAPARTGGDGTDPGNRTVIDLLVMKT